MRGIEDVGVVDDLSFGRYEGYYAVDLHTRYLTERRLVSGQRTYPFPSDVDPRNVLEEARGSRYVRVQENMVQYMKVGKDECGLAR